MLGMAIAVFRPLPFQPPPPNLTWKKLVHGPKFSIVLYLSGLFTSLFIRISSFTLSFQSNAYMLCILLTYKEG